MDDALDQLARHYGLSLSYDDPFTGERHQVPDTTKRLILDRLGVDDRRDGAGAPRQMHVPESARCWMPASLAAAPGWGIFCQLYELRSMRNWGIGDFADLTDLARIVADAGADFLGINPVHALFTADPQRRSPFFPSNRRFLNPLYIAPDRVPGVQAPAGLDSLRQAELLDYPAITRLKRAALRDAFARGELAAEAAAFAEQEGELLRLHALFEAISARMVREGHGAGWRDWPRALQDPQGPEVTALAQELSDEVAFHIWLQMIARHQLDEAAQAARGAGMRIGLYLDLAVGEAPDGSATWSGAAAAMDGLTVGAPPDMFSSEGQNWGLAAPSPTALREADFAPFRDMIAAQMRDAGALRIDHAMALWQLFLIPEGESPAQGTHMRYPFPDLLRVLSALSQQTDTLVIGEDLGFVPEGFRDAMDEANIFSYRILVFEQTEEGFKPPRAYPEKALACLSTHDLPVLAGWWRGEDVQRRRETGLVDEARSDRDARHRQTEKADMLRAFAAAGVLHEQVDPQSDAMPDAMLDAAHLFLARSRARLVGVRLADLVGLEAPTNLPGTVDEYPNWQPRSPLPTEALAAHPAFRRTAALLRARRPRPEEPAA